jgi:rod shape determining protein RodA
MALPSFFRKFDWILLGLVIAIVVLGVATFWGIGAKSLVFVQRQITFLILGMVIMIAVSFLDYRIFKNFSSASIAIYLIAIFLLILALASREIRGVSSWIIFKNFTFEPSEFAKLAILILLAKYFSQKHVEIYRAHHILASGFYVLIPAVLTLLQPDLGSTLVFVALWLAILLIAGIKRRHLLIILMIGAIISSLGWLFALKPYQKARIVSFINPYLDPRGSGYNALQARIAIGSGQIWGTSFTNQRAVSGTLVPEPYGDFAFSIFARKFGFFGVAVLFSLFAALMFRIGSIAAKTDNNFAKLFSLGFLVIVFTHVFINAGMNLGILPITGIPFSFLSYGGSHLMTLMIGLGIIQSIRINSRP